MFYDERVNDARAIAFRRTLALATSIFLLYGTLHAIYDIRLHIFNVISVAAEALCGMCGICILLFGEINYYGAKSDEMLRTRKNAYYAKAFYYFILFFAFVYCVNAPMYIINSKPASYPFNTVALTVEIPCWLLLLYSLKSKEVALNVECIAENRKQYWKFVLKNILKFGGIVALFTAISFGICFLYLIAIRNITLFTLLVAISILIAGFTTWVFFSLEYLLYSFAERVSDKAEEEGRLSGITLVFALIFSLLRILALLFEYTYSLLTPSGTSFAVISYVLRCIDWYSSYFGGLFAIYLMAELKHKVSKKFSSITAAYISYEIVVLLKSIAVPLLNSILFYSIVKDSGGLVDDRAYYETFIHISGVILMVFAIILLIISITALNELKKSGLVTGWHKIPPIGIFVSTVLTVIPTRFLDKTLDRSFNITKLIILTVMYISFFIGVVYIYTKCRRSSNKQNLDEQ